MVAVAGAGLSRETLVGVEVGAGLPWEALVGAGTGLPRETLVGAAGTGLPSQTLVRVGVLGGRGDGVDLDDDWGGLLDGSQLGDGLVEA